MIPIRDNLFSRERAVVTWTLVGLNVLVYLWDRGWSLGGPTMVFNDFAMRPTSVVGALTQGGDRSALATLYTSMFLHVNLAHLVGNMLFLSAFGPSVELALGGLRFALYYVFWGIMASVTHILVMPDSPVPALGASGAIGGVLGCYFLLFPGSRITVVIPPLFFLPFVVYAWMLLGIWFIWQIAFPQQGVANWAHAGGFLAGMATVLIAGGRSILLRNAPLIAYDDSG